MATKQLSTVLQHFPPTNSQLVPEGAFSHADSTYAIALKSLPRVAHLERSLDTVHCGIGSRIL